MVVESTDNRDEYSSLLFGGVGAKDPDASAVATERAQSAATKTAALKAAAEAAAVAVAPELLP